MNKRLGLVKRAAGGVGLGVAAEEEALEVPHPIDEEVTVL